MFGRRKPKRELDLPPIATSNSDAVEVLRVWAAPDECQQVTLQICWKEPGAWGLVLADIARHVAQAYGREGQNPEEVFRRIIESLNAELDSPTDDPEDLTDDVQ
jgi:hypothetical protein